MGLSDRNFRIVIVATAVCVLVAVAVIAMTVKSEPDPDYYDDPYYTLTYSVSTEQIPINGVMKAPSGNYTDIYIGGFGFQYWTGGHPTSNPDVGFVWWYVTVEVYSVPNEVYSDRLYFKHERSGSNNIPDDSYLRSSLNMGELGGIYGPGGFRTDSHGRATFSFYIGVCADEIMGTVYHYVFGAPRSITLIP